MDKSETRTQKAAGVKPGDTWEATDKPLLGGIRIEKSITVNKPVAEVYRFWRRFENLPRFMSHLISVTSAGDDSHWVAKGPAGSKYEWDASLIADNPDELISWRSQPGSDVENAGSVAFRPATGNQGTDLTVTLTYNPPAGPLGAAIAKLFGEEPSQQVSEDLNRFKQILESSERTSAAAQKSGGKQPLERGWS